MTHSFAIWWRRLAVVVAALLLASAPVDARAGRKGKSRTPQRTMEAVKRDKSKAEQKISETATKIKTNTKELNRQLNRLTSLNADIETNRTKVQGLKNHIDSLGAAINVTADSVKVLEKELEDMRKAYVKALKQLQPHAGTMNEISFIFSAKSFAEAYSRMRYLRQFSAWRERKAENIRKGIERIADRRAHLTSLRHSQDLAYRKAAEVQTELSQQQLQSEEMVSKLRKEDSALRRALNEQKKQATALDRELDRLIAAEQARIAREEEARRRQEAQAAKAKKDNKSPEKTTASNGKSGNITERSAKDVASANARTQTAASTSAAALTGSFEANKGKLLFPVAGTYKIVRRFGRQPHPTLPHVEVDNSGIDIEVRKGTSARAVFAGKVSYIFKQDGFNSIVMVRHGRYITIYAGLATVAVKQGDSVKAGQTLGSIYSDPDDGNRTKLHFEIRNERQKLNPTQWVR